MNVFYIEKIKYTKIPKTPGVYQFIDKQGEVLYVGKAKNLKNRIKSYFQKNLDRGPTIFQMMTVAIKVKIIKTDSEIEAVLLEAELIKKLWPKFNIQLKDDKSFQLIKISGNDFPTVTMVRVKEIGVGNLLKNKSTKDQYFGPYPSGNSLKLSLKFLRKLFPYRDCSEAKYHRYQKMNRACLFGDIGICTAPCVSKISKSEYRKNINYLKNFLRGRKTEIIKSLNRDMQIFSKKKKYEKAANTRDKLAALDHLHDVAVGIRDDKFESSKIVFKRIEAYDISNIQGEYAVGSMAVFEEGKKFPDQYRKFKIRTVNGANDLKMLEEMLLRRLRKILPAGGWPKPDLVVIDRGLNQLNIAKEILDKKYNGDVSVISISKGPKRDKNQFHFVDLPTAKYINSTPEAKAIILQARDEAHRFAISYYRLLHRKNLLK